VPACVEAHLQRIPLVTTVKNERRSPNSRHLLKPLQTNLSANLRVRSVEAEVYWRP